MKCRGDMPLVGLCLQIDVIFSERKLGIGLGMETGLPSCYCAGRLAVLCRENAERECKPWQGLHWQTDRLKAFRLECTVDCRRYASGTASCGGARLAMLLHHALAHGLACRQSGYGSANRQFVKPCLRPQANRLGIVESRRKRSRLCLISCCAVRIGACGTQRTLRTRALLGANLNRPRH